MKQLIAFDGNLALKDCCVKPQHRVREATTADVKQWAKEHGYMLMFYGDSVKTQPESACMCQGDCGCL